jgi:hypothetical protein
MHLVNDQELDIFLDGICEWPASRAAPAQNEAVPIALPALGRALQAPVDFEKHFDLQSAPPRESMSSGAREACSSDERKGTWQPESS